MFIYFLKYRLLFGFIFKKNFFFFSGTKVKTTPILLFCRNLKKGYVYCGQLGYSGHDPDRIPVRFVWELLDYDVLTSSEPFQDIVQACEDMFSYRATPLSSAVVDESFVEEKELGTKLLTKKRTATTTTAKRVKNKKR